VCVGDGVGRLGGVGVFWGDGGVGVGWAVFPPLGCAAWVDSLLGWVRVTPAGVVRAVVQAAAHSPRGVGRW
jgi:hypothetical protein